MPELLTLPFAVQIALGTGYLAYLIAYSGIRQHHTAVDAFFATLAFGLPASAVMYFGGKHWLTIALASLAPLIAAIVWRKWGRKFCRFLLKKSRISWTDDTPTAWLSLVAESTDECPMEIVVDLKDGRTLQCADSRLFTGAPHAPCIFGLDGSIALYVTSERRSNGEWFDHEDVRNAETGDRITYVPASSIERVEIRNWTKSTGKGATAPEPVLAQEVQAED